MNTVANNVASKLFVAFVAVAMLFMLVSPAKAATTDELQAQITALLAQIASLQSQVGQGGQSVASGVCPFTWTRSLASGATGADVMKLQQFLNADADTRVSASGVGSVGMETEYFGPATAAAVSKFQVKNGVVAVGTGTFGPLTMAKANMVCNAAPAGDDTSDDTSDDSSDDTTSGDLGNGEGSIGTVKEVGSDDSNINEGETGQIFAFTAEIDGDVEVNRVDMYMEESGSGSSKPKDYFQGATLYIDGEEAGTVDVSDFTKDDYDVVSNDATDEYRLRFSGLNAVFADGDKPEFTLELEANTTIDTTDLDNDWTVATDDSAIRFVDGEGFTDSDGATLSESFGFDAEEVAQLEVSESSDNPDAATIEVDDQDTSDEVTVLALDVEEKNGVDATIDDMTFTITTTGTADESAVVSEAKLFNGSDEIGSESVSNGGVVSFEDLGLDIASDDTVNLSLKLVFNGTEDYIEGDQVAAVFTSVDTAEDANGNDESDMDISGSAEGNTMTLRSTGISVDVTSATTDVTSEDSAGNDTVTFTWKIDVTAFGNDAVYINKDFADIVPSASTSATDVDQVYTVEVSTGQSIINTSGTISSTADDVTGDAGAYGGVYNGETFYKISDSETFTIVVTGTNVADAKQVRAYLSNIEWTTDRVTATTLDASSATFNNYSDNLADDSETPFKSIN